MSEVSVTEHRLIHFHNDFSNNRFLACIFQKFQPTPLSKSSDSPENWIPRRDYRRLVFENANLVVAFSLLFLVAFNLNFDSRDRHAFVPIVIVAAGMLCVIAAFTMRRFVVVSFLNRFFSHSWCEALFLVKKLKFPKISRFVRRLHGFLNF